MLEFLQTIEFESREARRRQMSEYRELLTRALPPSELDQQEQHQLAALIQQLSLKAEEVHAHARLLQDIARLKQQDAQLQALQDKRAAEQPALAAFIDKRTKAIAELDAEGGPIYGRCAELERQIQALQVRGAGDANAITRIHRDHAEFFAYTPPAPRPRLSESQMLENQRRVQVASLFAPVAAELKKTGKRNADYADDVLDAITLAFKFGQEQNPDQLLFRPAGGWPTVEAGFSPALIRDPRRGKIMTLARRMLKGLKDGSIDWGQVERDQDMHRGVFLGWLAPGTYQPLPTPDAEDAEPDETEAQETPQTL